MKSFVAVVALALFLGCSAKPVIELYSDDVPPEKGNANEYLDMVLKNVREMIYDQGMDPYNALDKDILGVHLEGDVAGIATIHRSGDATLEYKGNDALEIETTLTVYDLAGELKWATHFLLLPIEGSATATVSEVNVKVTLRVDLQSVRVIIEKFHVVTPLGKIESEIHANPIPGFDQIAAKINDLIVNFFKDAVVELFEGAIQDVVQKTIDKIGIPHIEDNRK